jgi:ketosteroid isomerase-like protein
MLRMTRITACFFALLLPCCAASAQTPAPAATPAPAQPASASAERPEIEQFQKIENSWSNAVNQRDQYALELVMSPLFVDVSANGDITTRNQQLALLITGDDKTLYLTQRVITVRMLGDIAVANGSYTLHHKVNSVQVDEKGVFTHVFERLRGGWVCVNSQRTALHENPKSKKGSNDETPFHFPLFGKGEK